MLSPLDEKNIPQEVEQEVLEELNLKDRESNQLKENLPDFKKNVVRIIRAVGIHCNIVKRDYAIDGVKFILSIWVDDSTRVEALKEAINLWMEEEKINSITVNINYGVAVK